MFNFVLDDEFILYLKGDDNQSYCYNDQEVEVVDVCIILELDLIGYGL